MIYKNISNNLKISVLVHYDPQLSNQIIHYWHYIVSIENVNEFPVQLLSRYWNIVDESGCIREVEGDGVIGQQPIIQPNKIFDYNSNVSLNTPGIMAGMYRFANLSDNTEFEAQIPSFSLDTPDKLIISN